MMKDKYPLHALALLVGFALAIGAGFPPLLLLILVVCPLSMFFMMRGMHGGQQGHDYAEGETRASAAHDAKEHAAGDGRPRQPSP